MNVKVMLLNLWAWVLLHPAEVLGAVVPALVAIATVVNARSKGAPKSWFARFVDALALRTRQGASNAGWSWPLIGRSVFGAAIDASTPAPEEPPARGGAGFASLFVLRGIACAVLALAFWLSGCAGGQPRLSPIAPRIVMREDYGTCIESGGKLEVPQGPTFALVTQACMMMMDASAARDASAHPEPMPEPESIPDKSDAGAVE